MVLKLFKGDEEIKSGSVINNAHGTPRLFSEITGSDSMTVSSSDGETIRTFIGSYPGYEIRDVPAMKQITRAELVEILKLFPPDEIAFTDQCGTQYTMAEMIEQLTPAPEPAVEVLTVGQLRFILGNFDPNLPVVGVFPDRPYQQLTAENIGLYDGTFDTFEHGVPARVNRLHVKIKPR